MGTDDGVLWVSTANGVARMQGEDVRALTVADGLPEEFVHSVYAEADGLTWFGSESFLTRYDGRSFTRFPVSQGGGGVRSIVRDAAGQLWAGVFGGGLLKFSPEGSQLYDVEDGLANANISVLAVDRDNRLWIGTMGGISVFDGTAFSTIDADDGLVGYHVRCFYQDDRGDMWAGTVGHGLFRVARDGSISEVSTENGLYDDGVWSLVPDTDGNVWMSSDRGVSRVALADLQAVADGTQQMLIPASFNQADGMRTSEANGSSKPSGWRMPDGRLWFVTQKGVVAIDPAYLPHVPVQPLIERVVTRRSETNGPALGLRHVLDGRDVEIEFSAISLLHADRVRFRYRLKGYDDWRTSQNRRVEYTNLPPGTYTFEVEAALGPEAWRGQAASQTLVVSRKFYETWWFVLVSVFTGSALIAAGYWLQRKHERSRQHLLEARIADRTKELRAERDKTAAIAQRLVEIDRYKTEFFTNMSHEFRTPLTLTIGPLEEALREEGPHVPTTVRRSMNMALRNARRLLRLITQLLDLARIETGALRLRASREDLAGLAHDLVLSFAPLGERKGLHVTIDRPADPVFAYVARDQMEQLLMNLLSNAIKFTPAGGAVTVSVAENPGTVVVEVRDTGVGMAEHELARVFDRFYRAEPRAHATSEDTIGSGIGLALVRDLAELHYATLDIESEVDQGTTVRLLLQAGSDHLSPAEIVDVETSDGSVRRLDVDPLPEDVQTHTVGTGDQPVLLIVDDHPDIREYVRAGFEPAYRVLEAKDGADGLQAIREHLPDIILSDVMMPRMDGVELCEAVRADAELSFLPIILLTAKASAEDAARGLKAEADDYVTKPFDMALLRARVANLIRSRKRLHERLAHLPAAEPTVSLAHTEAEVRFLDTIQALVRERLDDETYSVDDLAHSVGQSRRTLYRRLKQLTGETPHAFIQRLRIERACVLLKTENATVSEIAYAVGFRSVSHFSQVFRHQLGRSPTAYRTS
ncbi:MAG: response regulator, partial [Bacteroidota bacterium]